MSVVELKPGGALLADLGKPTMRGIRKCPKCSTFNGTRLLQDVKRVLYNEYQSFSAFV
jgi:hypothetical protein